MKNYKVGTIMEFDCGQKKVKGTFVERNGNLLKITITHTDYSFEKIGDYAEINEKYLERHYILKQTI